MLTQNAASFHAFTHLSAAIVLGTSGMVGSSAVAQNAPPSEDAREHDFRPTQLLPAQPAITQPPTIPARQVQQQVSDSEFVLGIEIGGEARAYPINMLTGPNREIINDTLGGVDIAAMWCHLCHSGIVYERQVNGRTLTFVVSGMLWKRTLVMMDLETRSLWSLLVARAMAGPLEGQELTALPSKMTTWEAWRTEHPETTVLNISRTSREFVKDYYRAAEQFVYGVLVRGQPYHISLAVLREEPVLNLELENTQVVVTFEPTSAAVNLFSRTVGEQTLTFTPDANGMMKDRETGTLWDRSTGEAREGRLEGETLQRRVGSLAFARAWNAFYPDSSTVQP